MPAIYDAAIEAFDEAKWQHSAPSPTETFGTSMMINSRMIGGSLRVFEGSIVRFLAFGHGDIEPAHRSRVSELFARLNPLLLSGSLEVDPLIGAVCRASVNLEALLDLRGTFANATVTRALVLDLALDATNVYARVLPAIEAVEAGGELDEIVASVGLTPPASIPAAASTS